MMDFSKYHLGVARINGHTIDIHTDYSYTKSGGTQVNDGTTRIACTHGKCCFREIYVDEDNTDAIKYVLYMATQHDCPANQYTGYEEYNLLQNTHIKRMKNRVGLGMREKFM